MSIFLLAFTIPPCLGVLYWPCGLKISAPAQITDCVYRLLPSADLCVPLAFIRPQLTGFHRGFGKGTASAVPLSVQTSAGFSPCGAI